MGERVPMPGTVEFSCTLGDASCGYLGLRYIATLGSRTVAWTVNRHRIHDGFGDMHHRARRRAAAATRDARLQQRI